MAHQGMGHMPGRIVSNIIGELTGSNIMDQDKDIEIERLTTTCRALNSKSAINQSLEKDLDVLNRRCAESDHIRKTMADEINKQADQLCT